MGNMEQRGSDQPALAGSFRADFEIAKARSRDRGSPVSLLSEPSLYLNLCARVCVRACVGSHRALLPPPILTSPAPELPLDVGAGGEEGD